MKISNKIQLSTNFLFIKIILLGAVCIFLILIFNERSSDSNFKDALEHKIYLAGATLFFLYFLTRSTIYYDETSLYIKKLRKAETVIPLKNVRSIFQNPLSVSRGTANFSVEYRDNSNEITVLKFNAPYSADSTLAFIDLVKKANPHLEIV